MKDVKRKDGTQLPISRYTPVRSIFDDFFGMPSLMDDFFVRPSMQRYPNISADIWEEDDNFFVKMALPGVKKEEIDIEVEADYVRIKGGQKKEEKDDTNKKYYFKSLETQFEQTFNLPTAVDASKVEASFKDGVLEVKLPKADEYKARKISIK
ncbi:MAG TPA: Hsp20/alpha crystallin family protein [Candidatus Dojkabacteria bacterium]|nr:Hsp20/alpha crystallin family protein [Candidatus Dojkabacteria bacterium]